MKATQVATGTSRNAVSAADGGYVLTNFPVGPYQLEVSKQSFTMYVQSGIVLQVNSDPAIDPALKVGAVTEQVVVEANATQVETRSSTVGQVVDNQRILELPLNGRNPTDLITLSGGAVDVAGGVGVPTVVGGRDFGGAPRLQVAGGSIFTVGYLLDGSNYYNMMGLSSLPMPFPDALQEFKVATSGVGTTDAKASEISAVTKSGTNELHGDLFEFIRNDVTNARQYFATTQSTLKRNQFGGTVGGAIRKNKLFFFGGYQQTTLAPIQAYQAFLPRRRKSCGDWTTFASAACQASGRPLNLLPPSRGTRFPLLSTAKRR